MDRQADTYTHTDRQTQRQTDTYTHTDRHKDRQIGRQTAEEINTQMDKSTRRKTER